MKRPIKSYLKPVHDGDCGIRRNDHMSVLAAHSVNQVMGEPQCTCGLAEALKKQKIKP